MTNILISMTQLLMHTIVYIIYFTEPSFMLKANKQPYKKFLGLAFSWVNVVKNFNFPRQKLSQSFQFLFSSNKVNLGAHFLLLTFFHNFNFYLFSKMETFFWRNLHKCTQDLKFFYWAGYCPGAQMNALKHVRQCATKVGSY